MTKQEITKELKKALEYAYTSEIDGTPTFDIIEDLFDFLVKPDSHAHPTKKDKREFKPRWEDYR